MIVPTLNASKWWPQFREGLLAQNIAPKQVLIVDSESTDRTADFAIESGFQVASIRRHEFNHGDTRQWASGFFPDAEILVFMTQDAILADSSALRELVAVFDDPSIGAAYGRQLPRQGCGPIEAHSRLFNYAQTSDVRSLDSRTRLGVKTIFISNSFAAYRRCALESVAGFPRHVILGEDTMTAAQLLLKGWQIAYVSDAKVYHSHEYSIWQEFQRYFDHGVLRSREPWLRDEFGRADGEGRRYVKSELKYLWPNHARLIPIALMRTAAKLAAYWLGSHEHMLSNSLKRKISMHGFFWE